MNTFVAPEPIGTIEILIAVFGTIAIGLFINWVCRRW